MRITFVTRKFGNVERNSHCDVLHFTPVRVANLVLDCNGVFAIKAYWYGTKFGGEIWDRMEKEERHIQRQCLMDSRETLRRIYVGHSIVGKTDARLGKGEDVVVCLPGARIGHVTERVEQIIRRGNGGSIRVHIGKNNADKEGTTER